MRKIFVYILPLFIISCSTYNPFFEDFDQVHYYHLKDVSLIDHNKIKDSTAIKIIYDEFPEETRSEEFFSCLGDQRFIKSNLNEKDILTLKKVFTEKFAISITEKACAPLFRDILIFKKNNKTIGIAKICLECEKFYLVGNKVTSNIDSFGENNEFEDLEIIFREYNK